MLSLVKALGDEYEITVVALARSGNDFAHARELEQYCSRVIPVTAPHRRSAFHAMIYGVFYQLKSMMVRRSLKGLYDCPGAMVRAAHLLSREHFDLVIISFWQLYRLTAFFPREKTVIVTYDIDLLVNREISLLERNLVKKIQAVRRWLVERTEELAAYRSAGHVWALTELDRAVVKKICRDSCSADVLPFGFDVDFYGPSGMQRNKAELLFVGNLDEAFNRDALDYFIRKIYPHIDDVVGLTITIVGGNLPTELKFFGLLPEVEVIGKVPDARPYLHRASCLVMPLRFGGGLVIHVLEAMAAGLPVVTSSAVMRGIAFEADKDFLLADQAEEFATRIRQVLGDETSAAAMAEAASRRVRELFGLEGQKRKAIAMVRALIEAP
jgi:glycosyltransferase involved in cell wall biosynthesis